MSDCSTETDFWRVDVSTSSNERLSIESCGSAGAGTSSAGGVAIGTDSVGMLTASAAVSGVTSGPNDSTAKLSSTAAAGCWDWITCSESDSVFGSISSWGTDSAAVCSTIGGKMFSASFDSVSRQASASISRTSGTSISCSSASGSCSFASPDSSTCWPSGSEDVTTTSTSTCWPSLLVGASTETASTWLTAHASTISLVAACRLSSPASAEAFCTTSPS